MPSPVGPEPQLFEFLKWLIGISITVLSIILGTAVGSFRKLSGRISERDNILHGRINKVQETFVRKDDLHRDLETMTRAFEREIQHLTITMDERHKDLKQDNREILQLLKKGGGH